MSDKLRIAVLWTHLTNYAYSCFSELASRSDVSLWVGSLGKPLYCAKSDDPVKTAYYETTDSTNNLEKICHDIHQHQPDIFIGCGWNPRLSILAARRMKQAGIPTVCCADTPWLGTLRQSMRCYFGGAWVRRSYDAILIPGARGLPVARLLGYSPERTWFNDYSGNDQLFSAGTEDRLDLAFQGKNWPKGFLFVGRLVPEKNPVRLIEAYNQYRAQSASPWPLTLIGDGPEMARIKNCEGVRCLGWLESGAIAQKMRESGAFILPSVYEPWGVVVHEAACAGLPLALSMDVGAGADLLRDGYNGCFFNSLETEEIVKAMLWIERHPCPWELGLRSYSLSKQFSVSLWADNIIRKSKDLISL
jgi:glycosyltransferase involved in cell wall biosynthesis